MAATDHTEPGDRPQEMFTQPSGVDVRVQQMRADERHKQPTLPPGSVSESGTIKEIPPLGGVGTRLGRAVKSGLQTGAAATESGWRALMSAGGYISPDSPGPADIAQGSPIVNAVVPESQRKFEASQVAASGQPYKAVESAANMAASLPSPEGLAAGAVAGPVGGKALEAVAPAIDGLVANLVERGVPKAIADRVGAAAGHAVAGSSGLGTFAAGEQATQTPTDPQAIWEAGKSGAETGALIGLGTGAVLGRGAHPERTTDAVENPEAGPSDGGVRPRSELQQVPTDESVQGIQQGGSGRSEPVGQPWEADPIIQEAPGQEAGSVQRGIQGDVGQESDLAVVPGRRSFDGQPGEEKLPTNPEKKPALEGPVPDTTGIAHRVSEARGNEANRGEGIGSEESAEHGRKMLAAGADPEKAVAGPLSADAMAIVRAHLETLSKAANAAADKHGIESPEYKVANKAERDWIARVKPMQTEWHRIGQAQQGETEVDTGTFHGLHREYQAISGREFTPKQAERAKQTATNVREKSAAVDEAQAKLYAALDKQELGPQVKSLADRIVASLDKAADESFGWIKKNYAGTTLPSGLDPTALYHLSRYGAAKIAKGAVRFAEWSAEMVKDVGEHIRPHLQQIWEASDKEFDRHVAGESTAKAAPKLRKQITEASDITKHQPGTTMTPARVKALWEKAKADYIAKGVTSFDEIVHKLAADTGLPVNDIRRGLAQPKGARELTNDLYAKQATQRRVITAAKQWVGDAAKPGWMKFVQGIPRAFFTAKVAGHGTVGMITHAPAHLFHPPSWAAYFKNFGRQYKLLGSAAYDEMMKQDLARKPNYITARRAGLANDVYAKMGDYEKGMLDRTFSKLGLAGARGFNALKFFRQDLFDRQWDGLPADLKSKETALLIADQINHSTGFVKKPMGGQMGAAVFFAPKLEGSRWAFLLGDPAKAAKTFANWSKETPDARAAAVREVKQKAIIVSTYLGALSVNQGLLSATGSDQAVNFTDPKRSDWLSFKAAGHDVGVVGPMLGTIKFLANIARDSMGPRSKLEAATSTRADKMMETTGKYVRGKLSPFGQVATDLATQSDYSGRPMPFSDDKIPARLRREGVGRFTYGEYAAQAALPIPFEEAVKEVLTTEGPAAWRVFKAVMVAASGSTGARLKESKP